MLCNAELCWSLCLFLPNDQESECYLRQVPEVARQSEVQLLRLVVGEDPGEDRVLVKVIIGSPWKRTNRCQVSALMMWLHSYEWLCRCLCMVTSISFISIKGSENNNFCNLHKKIVTKLSKMPASTRMDIFQLLDHHMPQSWHAVSILTCDGVEKHEVLEVRDLPPLPALGHVGGLEQLSRGGQRNSSADKIIKDAHTYSGQTAQK